MNVARVKEAPCDLGRGFGGWWVRKLDQASAPNLVLSLVLALVIFGIDLFRPLDLGEWVVYLLPVLFASRVKLRFYPYLFASLCTGFILFGYGELSLVAPWEYELVHRCLGLALLWILTAFLVQQNRAAEALREREHFFRLITGSMNDMVAVLNPEGVRLYNSPSYEAVLGDPQELVGTHSFEEIHPEDRERIRRLFQETLASGLGQRAQYRFRLKDGSIRYIESQGSVMKDPDSTVSKVVVVSRDITERVNLEAQMRQSQKMDAVGRLASGVAHDFNNLIGVIYGYTQRLLAKKDLDAETIEVVKNIFGVAERAANLTRQLLGFSRKHALRLAVVNLNVIIHNLGQMLGRILGEDIALQLPAANPGLLIEADMGMIEQVIMNLVVNARDAMPRGGQLTIHSSAVSIDEAHVRQHSQARVGEFVTFGVTDTGCGMDPAALSRIFEPFFTTKEVGKGAGLGLSTVYGIVSQHRGWIEVTSQVGQGTTFLIYLPRCARELEKAPEQLTGSTHPGQGETILIVEDEPTLLELTRIMVEDCGYKTLAAGTGADALKVWAEHKGQIDVLLTDLIMPGGLDGRELADRLRNQKPELKVIYTSGYSSDIVGKDLQQQGYFLQKPFQSDALARILRHCLDARTPQNKL